MVYVMSPAAHMSVIIVGHHLLGNPLYTILQVVSFRTSVILSWPHQLIFFCKGHGLPQLVGNIFLKGWNSDTARPEKGMHFVLLTLLFKDTEDGKS